MRWSCQSSASFTWTAKGFAVLLALVVAFLIGTWPREVLALATAGLLLTSRRMASRTMLQLIDWHLLVLFAGLFIGVAAGTRDHLA